MGALKKRIGMFVAVLVAVCMVCMLDAQICMAGANSWKIENASYNAPELKAYLYGAGKWDSIAFTSASLTTQAGEVRSLEYEGGGLLAQMGEGTEYIYLIDVTASMRDANIAMARQSVLEHLDALSGNDRIVVYSFSGKAQKVTDVTAGSINPTEKKQKKAAKQAKKAAKQAINQRLQKGEGDGKGSAVYRAMEDVMDFAARQDAKGKKNVPLRKVCLLLTDGQDRNFGSKDQATFEEKVRESHVAFYGIGLASQNRTPAAEEFRQLEEYCGISGGDWTYEPRNEARVYKALTKKRAGLANCFMAQFRGKNNQVSNAEEVLSITTEDNRSSTRTILANQYQKDKDAPKVEKIKKAGSNTISFTFSEAVTGADGKQNFTVKNEDGKSMQIKSVSYDSSSYKCEVVFSEDLYSGEYTLGFKNITDHSMEQNKPEKEKFDFKGRSPVVGGITYALTRFWWVFALAVIVGGGLLLYKKLNEQGGVIVRDGNASLMAHLSPKSEPKMKINTQGKDLYMTLREKNGKVSDIRMQIDSSITFGRFKGCNICINDPSVSRQHFVIEAIDGKAYISDLESKGGTMVNGSKITKDYPLHGGEEIRAGEQTLIFHKIQ